MREVKRMELQANRAGELAAQYLAGNRQAMEELIEEIQDKVYYYCVKTLRNETAAQDAAQDVLMAVFQGLDRLKNPAAFNSWLNRIIIRTCMKTYTREHREITINEIGEDHFFENLDDQQIPEKIIDTNENRKIIRDLVDELPPAQRLCILMYYYDELSVKDIAEAIDVPENTVKSRLSYARKAIKAGVDRWIAKGFTLYSFTPLPYLRYFLQKEAEECHLPPVVVLRIQEAILAAGAAGAAGAAVSSAGGAAAGLLHKGIIAVAGLLLAGGVGGMLLLHPVRPPDNVQEAEPPQVVERLPMPAEPETLEHDPEPVPSADEPVPQRQEPTAVHTPVPLPVEELPEGAGGESAPTPPPEENPVPEAGIEPDVSTDTGLPLGTGTNPLPPPEDTDTDPAPPPDTEDTDETAPAPPPNTDDDDDDDDDDDTDPTPIPPEPPEPTPPEPVPPEPIPPDPIPPVPVPPVTNDYQPNRNFGNYLGINADGIHEFDVYLTADGESWVAYPIEDNCHIRIEVSDESRVSYRAAYIYGVAPGSSEVRYYLSRDPEGPFELAVIVHVTVSPEEPITPDYNWGVYENTIGNVAHFRHTLVKGSFEYKTPFQPGNFYVKAVSDDPNTIEVNENMQLRAVDAGTTTVRYYTRWTENDPWVEAAVVKMTVLEEKPPEATVIESQTRSVRYGSNEHFFRVWQGDLPNVLRFTSSNPAVVYITQESGSFSALAPGTAKLIAYDPLKPNEHYVLEVQVEDAFAWEYAVDDVTLCVGERQEHEVKYTLQTSNGANISFLSINSADRNIADIEYHPQDEMPEDTIRFEIIGRSQGTVEVTGKIAFEVLTYDDFKRMETTFSFQVQVNEPPEDDIPTVRKEVEQFGKCSGYGYAGFFKNFWDEEIPKDGMTYLSSDPAVACISEWGSFTTVSAGTVVLTATSTEEPARRYALTLHVEDRLDCVRTIKEEEAWLEESSHSAFAPNYELSASGRLTNVQWTSSDPEILTVIAGGSGACSYKALKPGKAALNGVATFMIDTPEGYKTMKDEFSIPVTVGYYITDTEVMEAEQFGICSGYGYTGRFQDYFLDLPDGLTFSSSDPYTASMDKDGRFTTLKPGRVVLLAYTKYDPSGHQYAVWLNIQDAMDWTYSLEEAVLDVGGSVLREVTDLELHDGVTLSSAYWYAADSRVASVTRDADDPLRCRVVAKTSGTTVVTGLLGITTQSYLYGQQQLTSLPTTTVSFTVTVREPEAVNPDVNLDTNADTNPDTPLDVLPSKGRRDENS